MDRTCGALRLTGEEKRRMTKRYTESAEAYQFYLKGRYHWNKRTGEGLKKGIQYFQQAQKANFLVSPTEYG
jgi:hypothetical protein